MGPTQEFGLNLSVELSGAASASRHSPGRRSLAENLLSLTQLGKLASSFLFIPADHSLKETRVCLCSPLSPCSFSPPGFQSSPPPLVRLTPDPLSLFVPHAPLPLQGRKVSPSYPNLPRLCENFKLGLVIGPRWMLSVGKEDGTIYVRGCFS